MEADHFTRLNISSTLELLAAAEISIADIKREVRILRRFVDTEPDLEPLLDELPDDIDDLDLEREEQVVISQPDGIPVTELARKVNKIIKWNPGQKALAARQRAFNQLAAEIVQRWDAGDITADAMNALLRTEVKGLHISSAVSGKGFKWDDMTFRDWGRVGAEIKKQYGFLDNLTRKVINGEKSPAQIRADLDKFAEAASASYERTAVSRTGFPMEILPAVPGDGTTECYTRCKCFWSIRTLDLDRGDWDLSWRLGDAEHCRTCRKRADRFPRGWAVMKVRDRKWKTPPPIIFANH